MHDWAKILPGLCRSAQQISWSHENNNNREVRSFGLLRSSGRWFLTPAGQDTIRYAERSLHTSTWSISEQSFMHLNVWARIVLMTKFMLIFLVRRLCFISLVGDYNATSSEEALAGLNGFDAHSSWQQISGFRKRRWFKIISTYASHYFMVADCSIYMHLIICNLSFCLTYYEVRY